ncbi:M3 family oligoendopeptidase [Lederbergia sp. NSJ-179]|uniref:M3 family oligoendopeptidase n=1 Tax=Lederbergia sp. NSJ-179 TaxID=2931402 RepID=UPI001FD5C21E|nr:M3 family oligoendopeptidase [Lederbergia sp. NSJ-179]MCJ7841967.1 M3 family oligoendopeptidase [Lederbergia sp. NSJ-179]
MEKFQDFKYVRPKLSKEKEKFTELLAAFEEASNFAEATKAIDAINILRNRLSTMNNLVYIRSSIDTNDTFYKAEKDFFDEKLPEMEEMDTQFYQLLVKSAYRQELEEEYGTQLFQIADKAIKSFAPEVMELMQKENKLTTEYSNLIAAAEIEFQGNTYTLAQLAPFKQDKNRNTRKQAVDKTFGYYADNSEKFDRIYDELVKIRHEIATTLGYTNFVELGYLRMQRIDYNAEMVDVFRKQVRDVIVPLATKLYERQAKRIEVDTFMFYDEDFKFKTGNATPKGSSEWIVENGKKMYAELSKETNEFFRMMLDRELMDLEAKKGKEGGGYCTFIEDYQVPFIFSNFNGTSDDIDVLTHEAGHAFQSYSSRTLGVPEYVFPTSESAEIHSMSMEFFTWPWMELFFEEDADKYKFSHLVSAIQFIPYGVAVDEFQHLVYENPNWTPEERKSAWREIEKVYLPHRNYDDNAYLEQGGLWQRQAHIYEAPFYYIDYTLAQICALQFWKKNQENHQVAWQDYLNLCKLGGSKPFLELVAAANIRSPFEEGTVEATIDIIEKWLNQVDDTKL